MHCKDRYGLGYSGCDSEPEAEPEPIWEVLEDDVEAKDAAANLAEKANPLTDPKSKPTELGLGEGLRAK